MTSRAFRRVEKIGVAFTSIVVSVLFLIPALWMVITSFKQAGDIFSIPPSLVFKPTLINYRLYFERAGVTSRYLNTVIVSVGASALSVFVGSLCGYGLARLKIRGHATLGVLILASRAIPPISMVVPLYLVARRLGVLDKHLTLIVTYTSFLIPYVVWLTRGFFLALPSALEDAALVDGCTRFGAFFRIILPNALPGLIATTIFCIVLAWNELLFALILTNREAVTIPVSISGMASDTEQGALWGPLSAVGTLTVVPVVVFSLLVQKHLVTGLAAGATAGASN
jgi:multiple sugar transport system permease protein